MINNINLRRRFNNAGDLIIIDTPTTIKAGTKTENHWYSIIYIGFDKVDPSWPQREMKTKIVADPVEKFYGPFDLSKYSNLKITISNLKELKTNTKVRPLIGTDNTKNYSIKINGSEVEKITEKRTYDISLEGINDNTQISIYCPDGFLTIDKMLLIK